MSLIHTKIAHYVPEPFVVFVTEIEYAALFSFNESKNNRKRNVNLQQT